MATLTIEAAETDLPRLLEMVASGDEIFLTRDGKSVAKLSRHVQPEGQRQFGSMRGMGLVGPEFFEPLPEEELAAWE